MTSKESKEDTALVRKDENGLDFERAKSYCKYALALAYITVIGFFCISIATMVTSIRNDSASGLAVALETLLDSLTSIVVIWRFTGSITPAMLYGDPRERLACIALGGLCLFVSVVLGTRSGIGLSVGSHERPHVDLLYVLCVSGSLGSFLFWSKVFVAYQLKSLSIFSDAMTSGIGALLAITSIGAYFADDSMWYLDGTIGVSSAVLLCVYGGGIMAYEMCGKTS